MPYDDLQSLLQGSSSARDFFLTLPVEIQMTLHAWGPSIRTAGELHLWAGRAGSHLRQCWSGRFIP